MEGRTWWKHNSRSMGSAAPCGSNVHALQPGSVDTDDNKEICLRVLGPVEVIRRQRGDEDDITHMFTPKQQELLVCLAVALERGVRREPLSNAVWPACSESRPYNSLHNAVSLIRRTIATVTDGVVRAPIVRAGTIYKINFDLIEVDYWQFRRSLRPEATDNSHRIDGARRAAELYRGDLAENIVALWLETPREAARREVLDALGVLVQDGARTDLPQVIGRLEQIRLLDCYNEGVYREVMRAQARLGQVEAARRTYGLLVKALKDIGQRPATDTVAIMSALRSGPYPSVAS